MSNYLATLAQFEKDKLSYRAEIQYDSLTYVIWKCYGIVRRLEIFTGNIIPNYYDWYIVPQDLLLKLPVEIRNKQWRLYRVI